MVNKYLKCKAFVGERIEVVSFWKNKVTRGAAMAVLSAALLGCSNTESWEPLAKAEVPEATAAVEFTTKGKPTKTIETPWGPREIYDPVQDEDINQIFQKWYAKNKYSVVDYAEYLGQSDNWNVFLEAEALQSLDLKRAGCESIIQSNGYLESMNQLTENTLNPITRLLYFKKDCAEQHTFGSAELSSCESENKSVLPRSDGGQAIYAMIVNGEEFAHPNRLVSIEKSEIKVPESLKMRGVNFVPYRSKRHEIIGYSSGKNYLDQLKGIFEQSCEKWRGSKPHESVSMENGFTLFDRYPDEPLVSEQFQTPIYRDYIKKRKDNKK